MKEAKVFSRESPCTKIDIHNAFISGGRYVDRSVVEAKMQIGDNAPKYLMREGIIRFRVVAGVDTYTVTVKGVTWIREGVIRFMQLHPERIHECIEPPDGSPTVAPRTAQGVRRTRATSKLLQPVKTVLRRVARRK